MLLHAASNTRVCANLQYSPAGKFIAKEVLIKVFSLKNKAFLTPFKVFQEAGTFLGDSLIASSLGSVLGLEQDEQFWWSLWT